MPDKSTINKDKEELLELSNVDKFKESQGYHPFLYADNSKL